MMVRSSCESRHAKGKATYDGKIITLRLRPYVGNVIM